MSAERLGPSVAVVVQARMGSRRLPGKIARSFGTATLLEHILGRLRRARTTELVVATSTEPSDDRTEELARAGGAGVHRGSETDVLWRFAECVERLDHPVDVVVRVCADRPFLCPRLLDSLVDRWELAGRPDYLSNTLTRSYPDGLDLELVRPEALAVAASEATDPYEREHVTPFLYRRPERFRLVEDYCPWGNYSWVRATVDEERDLVALRAVHERLAEVDPQFELADVINLATLDPGAFP